MRAWCCAKLLKHELPSRDEMAEQLQDYRAREQTGAATW